MRAVTSAREAAMSAARRPPSLRETLRADTWRQYDAFSWTGLIAGVLARRTFRAIVTMRLCQWAARSGAIPRLALPLFKALHYFASYLAAMDLPWSAEIGPGLALTHGWGVVVSPGARIGANVTLFHGVTLGLRARIARDGRQAEEYPVLEDEVWVGPHAILVGGVTIGRGSRIAGGAFVTESVPAHSIVVGNPARILKQNCVPDVSNPAPL